MVKSYFFIILIITSCLNLCHSQDIWEPTSGPQSLDASDFTITSDGLLVISAKGDGIYLSNDQGLSWQKNSNGLSHPNSYATSMASGSNGIVYAIVEDHLYRLKKNSSSWEPTGNRFVRESKVIANFEGSVFVITDSARVNLYISKDEGSSFDTILNNPQIRELKAYSLNGNDNNYVLVLGNIKSDLYRVSDDGLVVTKIYSASLTNPQMIWDRNGFVFIISSGAEVIRMDSLGKNLSYITWSPYDLIKIFKKSNGRLLLLTRSGDYESSDQGVNWTKVNSTYYKNGSQGPDYFFQGNTVYLLNTRCISNDLYKSEDEGHSWIEIGDLFSNPNIFGLSTVSSGNVFSTTYDCFSPKYNYTVDKGLNWRVLNTPISNFGSYNLLSNASGNLFIINTDIFYKSEDYGNSWKPLTIFNTSSFGNISGNNKNLLYASAGFHSNGGYFSNDGGQNWFIPKFSNIQFSTTLQNLYEHPDGTLFSINHLVDGGLIYSNDRGMSWDTSSIHFDGIYGNCMTKSGLVYVSGIDYNINGYEIGLYISRDKLQSFEKIYGGYFYDLISDNDENLYALDSTGSCKKSIDGGKTWQDYSNGLPQDYRAISLAIDKDQYLYIGMYNSVVYKTMKPVSKAVKTVDYNSNDEIKIYPNPANEEIHIYLLNHINYPLHWQLFNTYGQRILSGDIKSEKTVINIQSIPNGIYFLKFGDSKLPIQKIVIQH